MTPFQAVLTAAEIAGKVRQYRKGYYATRSPNRTDHNPSILFGETESGRPWIKDLAGKETPAEVLKGWGLNPDTLKPETNDHIKPPRRQPGQRRRLFLNFNRPDATYNYTHADGTPSYQVRRVNFINDKGEKDKSFCQYRWEDGRYQRGRGETPELLYNLPKVVGAEVVFSCEGEKDADNLNALGYVATTHAGGAKAVDKALPAYRESLCDKLIIHLPHNDEPGRAMAQALARGLHGIAAGSLIVSSETWGEQKADVSDLIARRRAALLSNEEIKAELDRIFYHAPLWGATRPAPPTGPGPKALAAREQVLAESAQRRETKQARAGFRFDYPIHEADRDKCEITVEHPIWTSEGGKGQTFYYCNDPAHCSLCRERHTIKLKYYLEEIARFAYIDENGNAAYSRPELTESGEFLSKPKGPGRWYAKILGEDDRRSFRTRYNRARPGGFIKPEVYPVYDGYEPKYIALSLAPFEDMQPADLTDDLLQRIAIGIPHTRASLLFGPPRKQLERALPRYSFEIPQYLNERGIVATVPAPHTVLFTGPVKAEDIYSSFNTKAQTFDEIGLILEEVAEKSIDSERLRGQADHAPDYVIQSICIVPEAKPAYLAVWNAGREGDTATLKKFKRGGLPPLPGLKSQKRVDKGIVHKLYMPLSTRFEPQVDYQAADPAHYYARLEYLLETGVI